MSLTSRLLCLALLALACGGFACRSRDPHVTAAPRRVSPPAVAPVAERRHDLAGDEQRWDTAGKAFMLPLEVLIAGLK